MFAPFAIARGLVVDPREELELVDGHLLRLDAQLVVQFPLRGALHAQHSGVQLRAGLARHTQRVRAASVRPHVREGDLFGGALLQKQALVGIEEENGEGAVEETAVDVGHQMACGRRSG